jgi:ketosteroid isomerase-like protein
MTSGDDRHVVARYFEMWNTGDSSVVSEILSPHWADHAHPEVTGYNAVREAVSKIRAAQPGLTFRIETIFREGDLVAALGHVSTGPDEDQPASRLMWLIRMDDGRMAEMWTFRDTTQPPGR